MSVFSGMVIRRPNEVDATASYKKLEQAFETQVCSPSFDRIRGNNYLFLKYDFGAFGSDGAFQNQKSATVMAGHPYVDTMVGQPRLQQLHFLADALTVDPTRALKAARGSYCLAALDTNTMVLTLATDCLGIRPLYFHIDDDCIVFSTSLSVFRTLNQLGLGRDTRGCVEMASLGYCLSERTPISGVSCLRGGEFLTITADAIQRGCYWNWDALPTSQADEQEQQRAVYQAFVDAVKIRLDSERRVMAFLTGGLDSRCVVAALTGQGIKVNSMNFAADRSQDLILGAQLASALGTNHFSFPMSTTDSVAGRIPVALPKWIDHCQSGGLSADRPHLVWSGDGGSVGLGHVYLTEPMVDDIESGQGKRAVDKVLAELRSNVPVGALKLAYRTQYADALTAGFYEEFDRLVDRHTGRALYTLLMCTDQRRHLHSHFELLGQHQCELQLPYFDRDFVATVMAQPVRSFLLHRFYNRWLNLFQKEVREVPWQAYPGHVPCPIPLQSGLSYQWDTRTPDYFHKFHRAQSLRVLKGIFAGRYSNCELSQTRVVVAAVLTATRLRDYSYVLQFAEAFTHYS